MSLDRFEKSVQDWYSSARTTDLEYLNLETFSSKAKRIEDLEFIYFHKNEVKHFFISKDNCLNLVLDLNVQNFNNIAVVYDRLMLSTKIGLKYFHQISDNQNKHHESITRELKKIQKDLKNLQRDL